MKKGDAKFVMLVVLVFLAIFLGVDFVAWGTTIVSLFTGQPDAEAKDHFEAFQLAVKTLIEDENPAMTIRTPLKVPSDYVLVAFDTTDFYTVENLVFSKSVMKPMVCGKDACICLFKEPAWGDLTEMEKSKIGCMFYEKKIYFYTSNEFGNSNGQKTTGFLKINPNDKSEKYYNLVLYGKNKDGMKEFGIRDVWMEKQHLDGSYYIYFTEYDEKKSAARMSQRQAGSFTAE